METLLVVLLFVLFNLVALKVYINYRFDLEEREEDVQDTLHVAPQKQYPKEVKIRIVDDEVVHTPSYLATRLREVREIDYRAEFLQWKKNVQEYNLIHHKIRA